MKRIVLSLTLVLIGGFFGLKAFTDNLYGQADIINGKALYTNNCAVCHGPQGHGDGVAAKGLTVSPDNIYEEVVNPFGFKAELINSVLEGDNGQDGVMPAFKGTLTEQDVNDILGYIESIN